MPLSILFARACGRPMPCALRFFFRITSRVEATTDALFCPSREQLTGPRSPDGIAERGNCVDQCTCVPTWVEDLTFLVGIAEQQQAVGKNVSIARDRTPTVSMDSMALLRSTQPSSISEHLCGCMKWKNWRKSNRTIGCG